MRMLQLLAIGAFAAFSPHIAAAGDRLVVVELFTSQGCSSCPPANAFLNDLAKQRSDVLALAFHVTYWDYLGWKDPFSIQLATDRQARYGKRFGDGSYTPEIVVDGGVGLVGSDRVNVSAAIAKSRSNQKETVDSRIFFNGGRLSIDVGSGSGVAKVQLIGFDREHVTSIGRGENRGRTMPESNIVRSFRSVGDWQGTPMHVDQPLPEGEEFAVILEAPDGRVISAARTGAR